MKKKYYVELRTEEIRRKNWKQITLENVDEEHSKNIAAFDTEEEAIKKLEEYNSFVKRVLVPVIGTIASVEVYCVTEYSYPDDDEDLLYGEYNGVVKYADWLEEPEAVLFDEE